MQRMLKYIELLYKHKIISLLGVHLERGRKGSKEEKNKKVGQKQKRHQASAAFYSTDAPSVLPFTLARFTS